MRTRLLCGLAFFAMLALCLPALHADTNTCDSNPTPAHDFTPQLGDTLQPRHLELTRPYAGAGRLALSICSADLIIRTRRDFDHLRLVVDLGDQPAGHTIQDFIDHLRIQPDAATIALQLPRDAHATVTLEIPMPPGSSAEINLGHGDLNLNTLGAAGDREVNVGAGTINLITGGDRSYSALSLNIGMGTLHDHRPGGHNGHFVIARSDAGSGSGSLQINLGLGTVNIRD